MVEKRDLKIGSSVGHKKSLQKEKAMTSYQAPLQNRRLPKGFVCFPVDSESCELQEPGG